MNKLLNKDTLTWIIETVGKLLIGICLYFMSQINDNLKDLNKSVQQIARTQDIQEVRIKYVETRVTKVEDKVDTKQDK